MIGLNMKYTNKRTKFRIAGTVQKETPQEVEQTHFAVLFDRMMCLLNFLRGLLLDRAGNTKFGPFISVLHI